MVADNTQMQINPDLGPISGSIPNLGLGLLCWKGYRDFDRALASYEQAGLFAHFDEKLIWFQEIDAEARALADKYGLPCAGTPDNRGILGGFDELASALQSKTLLLLENDLPLIEPDMEVTRQLKLAHGALCAREVQVFRLRHTRQPGQKFNTVDKYQRFHGPGLLATCRRALRPGKAQRLAGTSVYVEALPEEKFPELVVRQPAGWLRVSAAGLPWTNQSVMVQRDFFLQTIIAHAKANPSPRRVNGFPDIEKEWNCPKWRKSSWTIGVDRGLFTHERA